MKPDNRIYRALRIGLIHFFADDKSMALNGFKVEDFEKCMDYLQQMYMDSVNYTTMIGDNEC